ncbi:hypothetical protein [Frigidibacter sp. ROC022]|uniref:hypothetical protein n=1 Tax=Frigidibacter sp. ROC022 TaxID=2971796 RepID=UPI00215AAD0E|nr:hypothetical protein [Frigidibacter sp. ROC022]MCR8725435.1 hypothetical protein [Frigidibacter sp. ROC022]
MSQKSISPLTRARAVETIRLLAQAVQAGETAVTYSDFATRLGLSRVNPQGLASYLKEAAAICERHGLPNIATLVATKASIDAGAPMPSEGKLTDSFYEATGLTAQTVPAEQARARAFDWAAADLSGLEAERDRGAGPDTAAAGDGG